MAGVNVLFKAVYDYDTRSIRVLDVNLTKLC